MVLFMVFRTLNQALRTISVSYEKDGKLIEVFSSEEVKVRAFMTQYSVGPGYFANALKLEIELRVPVGSAYLQIRLMNSNTHEEYMTARARMVSDHLYVLSARGLGPELMLEVVEGGFQA